jgi:hypothetical protein
MIATFCNKNTLNRPHGSLRSLSELDFVYEIGQHVQFQRRYESIIWVEATMCFQGK